MSRLSKLDSWLESLSDAKQEYGYRGEQWGCWITSGRHKVFALIRSKIKDRPAYKYRVNALLTLKHILEEEAEPMSKADIMKRRCEAWLLHNEPILVAFTG